MHRLTRHGYTLEGNPQEEGATTRSRPARPTGWTASPAKLSNFTEVMIAIRHGSLDADAVITRIVGAQEQSRRKGMRVRDR
jgi:hypothetical protein